MGVLTFLGGDPCEKSLGIRFLTQVRTLHISFAMAAFIGILYGLHIVLVIYLMTFLAVRSSMKGGRASILLVLGKYLIYWALISFGFKRLPPWAILSGFSGGIFLSLPILYWVNKKWVDRS
jgi:hypothetical protein